MTQALTAEDQPFLDEIYVLEIGSRTAVGACGSLLADLGATVMLVEPSDVRDDHKWINRHVIAAGKQSIVLDRTIPAAAGEMADLLAKADVVLLSSDLDSEELAIWGRERPRTQIICDITAFGHEGPLAGTAFSEPLVQAVSGVCDTMGPRDGPPVLIGAPLLDMETGVYAASAILAALRVRSLYGEGQRIDMALYDVAVNALLTFIPLCLTGKLATRNGNRHPTLSPWNAYEARDGWVLICAPTDDQWKRLCTAMSREECIADPVFASTTARMDNVDEVDQIISAWSRGHAVEDCVRTLTVHGIPCGPIESLEALKDEPNLVHRRMIRKAYDPVTHVPTLFPGSPLGACRGTIEIPARGQHRGDILRRVSCHPVPQVWTRGDACLPHRPLEGVRIVEIGMNTVAPLACKQLGALGADVIKVEPPTGDTNRWNAPLHENGESYVFALSNTDKRGVVLNLREERDKERLFRLLETADVVIENLKPGSLDKLGIGAKDVLKRFPTLIYCSVSGFGHDSVYPGRPALDTVIQGLAGVMSATMVDGTPTKAGISISDQLGGLFAMLAILAAIERNRRTGEGAYFDMAMQDSSAWATSMLWNKATPSERVQVVRASDGFIAVQGDEPFLTKKIAERTPGESFKSAAGKMDRETLVTLLNSGGNPIAAPILSVDEVMSHPQTAARHLLLERQARDGCTWTLLGSPLHLNSTPAEVRAPMARLGYPDERLQCELERGAEV